MNLRIWVFTLIVLIISLLMWAIFFIPENSDKIAAFGIVVAVVTALTLVLTVVENNKKSKQREYDLILLKEKQKVFEHFYNAYFEMLNTALDNRKGNPSKKVIEEMMKFKRGLMNWGSEKIIEKYYSYDNELQKYNSESKHGKMMKITNDFLKEIRNEMGFQDSKGLNIVNIILTSEARKQMDALIKED